MPLRGAFINFKYLNDEFYRFSIFTLKPLLTAFEPQLYSILNIFLTFTDGAVTRGVIIHQSRTIHLLANQIGSELNTRCTLLCLIYVTHTEYCKTEFLI